MKIGITYDTAEMYDKFETNDIHFDFADTLSISQLKNEFQKLGCKVELIGNKDSLLDKIKTDKMDYDLIYNTVEGINSRNRESLVPSILEACGIKYMGTDAYGLALSLDKTLTKLIAMSLNIKTPKYCTFYNYENLSDHAEIVKKLEHLSLPIIVKPNNEGNSSGIKLCDSYSEAAFYVADLRKKYGTSVLCEEFIFGTEITVPVIGNDEESALWCVTTVNIQRNASEWLDVNAKTAIDYCNVILDTAPEIELEFKSIVFMLFRAIGCRDFARFDFRLSEKNEIYFIELNPLPALFYGGSFDVLGRKYGLSYHEILRLMINTAAERLAIPKI